MYFKSFLKIASFIVIALNAHIIRSESSKSADNAKGWCLRDKQYPTSHRSVSLYDAAKDGNLALVKTLVHSTTDINSKNGWEEETPLHAAAREGHTEIVEELLKNGAHVNVLTYGDNMYTYSATPLFEAARNGHLEIVKLLLSYGANHTSFNQDPSVDEGDEGNVTPLVIAIKRGHFEIAKVLTNAGAHFY